MDILPILRQLLSHPNLSLKIIFIDPGEGHPNDLNFPAPSWATQAPRLNEILDGLTTDRNSVAVI
jgi:hypothetical protein